MKGAWNDAAMVVLLTLGLFLMSWGMLIMLRVLWSVLRSHNKPPALLLAEAERLRCECLGCLGDDAEIVGALAQDRDTPIAQLGVGFFFGDLMLPLR
jgi:hypothetical protein